MRLAPPDPRLGIFETVLLIGGVAVERLADAEEVFLTGSIRGVEPACACGGIGNWAVGPVTLRLREALARTWLRTSPEAVG